MAASLIAALAAFFASIFALLAPGADPVERNTASDPVARSSLEANAEDLRAQIRAFVETTLSKAGADGLSAPELALEEPQRSITPVEPEGAAEGCETDEASGEGWARSMVRCVQRSAGGSVSNVVVSSSSSNVTVP